METTTTSQIKTSAVAQPEVYIPNPLLASPEADRFAARCMLLIETRNLELAESVTTMQPA